MQHSILRDTKYYVYLRKRLMFSDTRFNFALCEYIMPILLVFEVVIRDISQNRDVLSF